MSLSKAEQWIYDHFDENRGQEIKLTDLAPAFYAERKRKPKNAAASVATMMRTIMLKTRYDRKLKAIKRVSGLGRGIVAVYRMK